MTKITQFAILFYIYFNNVTTREDSITSHITLPQKCIVFHINPLEVNVAHLCYVMLPEES